MIALSRVFRLIPTAGSIHIHSPRQLAAPDPQNPYSEQQGALEGHGLSASHCPLGRFFAFAPASVVNASTARASRRMEERANRAMRAMFVGCCCAVLCLLEC